MNGAKDKFTKMPKRFEDDFFGYIYYRIIYQEKLPIIRTYLGGKFQMDMFSVKGTAYTSLWKKEDYNNGRSIVASADYRDGLLQRASIPCAPMILERLERGDGEVWHRFSNSSDPDYPYPFALDIMGYDFNSPDGLLIADSDCITFEDAKNGGQITIPFESMINNNWEEVLGRVGSNNADQGFHMAMFDCGIEFLPY